MVHSSVVVDEIDIVGMSRIEAEDDSPVGADAHGPAPPQIAAERVQSEAREIQRIDGLGVLQGKQDAPQLRDILGGNLASVSALVEPLQAAVLDAGDYVSMMADKGRLSSRVSPSQ